MRRESDTSGDHIERLTRYELKATISPDKLARLESWIELHPLGFRLAYPDRLVQNIYFDSYDLACFEDNLIGESAREKLRLRWYGPGFSPQWAWLERKIKRNRYGWKERCSVDLADRPLLEIEKLRLTEELKRQAGPDFRPALELLAEPVVYNRYWRSYFEDASGRIRLTLDRDLAFCGLRPGTRLDFRQETAGPDLQILEVKFDRQNDMAGIDLFKRFDLRISKFSKYVFGVQQTELLV